MNTTQNTKISQIKEDTLIVGVDIGSTTHYARAFNWRGIEFGKVYKFSNCRDQFDRFQRWMRKISGESGMNNILVGVEPTGHYWFNLGSYLESAGIQLCMVNPYHVKQTKELDDNSQTKNDQKDPKVIAKLVIEGRFSIPYMPCGVYADLRILNSERLRASKKLIACKNQIERWLSIYFPEYHAVFQNVEAISSMMVLEKACTPVDVVELGAEGINALWRAAKIKAVGLKRANKLVEVAKSSVGQAIGLKGARMQIRTLLQEYRALIELEKEIMEEIEALLPEVPGSEELPKIKGIGIKAVAGFLAEVGNIRRFNSPKQIQKLAGLSLRENSSGKHKGETTISRRGRARLRGILFNATIPLLATNESFQSIHRHYTERKNNPLKRKQSVIAICCKLIRIFYAILRKGAVYDEQKMLKDIQWHDQAVA